MKLALVGLGAVGTSIGLAIKSVTDRVQVVGHDPDPERAKRAKSLRAVDQTEWNLISACEGADLVYLDLPLGEFAKTMEALAKAGVPSGAGDRAALIMDNVPVKRPVIEIAERTLWEGAEFIGGHLVSPRLSGEPEPSAELVSQGVLYLVPLAACSETSIDTATNLALSLGAEPRYIDAAEHDGIIASASQLPHLLALALLNTLRSAPGAAERSQLPSPAMAALKEMLGVEAEAAALLTNKDNLLHWMDACERELASWRNMLATEDDAAATVSLATAREDCLAWLHPENAQVPEAESALGLRSLLFGDLGRLRRGRAAKRKGDETSR